MQIVDGPPVRDRIERLRFQLVLLILWVVHGGWGGERGLGGEGGFITDFVYG